MEIPRGCKNIGLSLESNVRDAYSKFIRGVEDYENQWEASSRGLWGLFNPVYSALANSQPPSVEREEWARDLILAYRSIENIKTNLLECLNMDEEHSEESPLDDL